MPKFSARFVSLVWKKLTSMRTEKAHLSIRISNKKPMEDAPIKYLKYSMPFYMLIFFLITFGFSCNPSIEKSDGIPLKSGERIVVGDGSQNGPLAPGLQSTPVGRAYVFGHEEPDLFVMANKHSLDPGPGLYLFEWTGRNDAGSPVFAPPRKVALSLINPNLKALRGVTDTSPDLTGSIFQTENGEIHGWWLSDSEIYRTVFDREKLQFENTSAGKITMTGLPDVPAVPTNLTVWQHDNNTLQILLTINDGVNHRPVGFWRAPDYIMYNGAGVFVGNWPYEYLYSSDTISLDVGSPLQFHQYSLTKKEVLQSFLNLTFVEYGTDGKKRMLTGSRYGNFLYYPAISIDNPGKSIYVCNESGIVLRHKAIGPFPISYSNQETKLFSDLIVGGETDVVYYQFTGSFHTNRAPIYGEPIPVFQQNSQLYTGTLPVINAVDWDNNGQLDIVSGNSEGRVVLILNHGSNESPSFANAQLVKAGGRPIHIQPGYVGSVQGPGESRWGYSCPTFTDWDGDGLFDILMHSSVSRHEVYLNSGEPGKPEFDFPVPIYCEGLDLHGTWRVQPGVNKLDDKMAYVILDDDNEFHLYWQIDVYNVEDGGKLLLEDGSKIGGGYLSAGGTGRLKIVLEDWDLDGKTDLLVGTTRHSSVPNPISGLPQSKGKKGATVLFIKNVGTNSKPVFAFPQMLKFKGNVLYLGQHASSPEVWDYGQSDGPDLIAGEQDGRIRYFARKDLSWDSEN